MLTISEKVTRRFSQLALSAWAVRGAQQVWRAYPDHFENLEICATDLVPLCEEVGTWAIEHQVKAERDVLQLCLVAISLGHRFWQDPRFLDEVARTLGARDLPRNLCASRLSAATESWLTHLWSGDSVEKFARRLSDSVLNHQAVTAQTLWQIVPGHWSLFSHLENEQLIGLLVRDMPAPTPHHQLVYVAGALVHGVHWLSDPHHRAVVRDISSTTSPEQLADIIHRRYGSP